MLEARNARRTVAASSRSTWSRSTSIARSDGSPPRTSIDQLRAEIRDLVIARNYRRQRARQAEPLDVEPRWSGSRQAQRS